ncbi:MAG TPA: hypothetical protein VKV33_07830, partial [Streptosporangiaceae bacterium]|nr:hypothetical protein [Streptosporangiaceae bacterium]
MEIRVQGSGGTLGWPEAGCRCASCQRARAQRVSRGPFRVIVGGALLLGDGPPALVRGGADAASAYGPLPGDRGPGDQGPGGQGPGDAAEFPGFRVVRLPGGWDVTGPDGARVLCAAGPGASPGVPSGAGRYDAVLLDLLGDPAQLGGLRARGLVGGATVAVTLFADHRVRSEAELDRRCRIWRAVLPRDGDTISVPAPAPETAAAPGPSPAAGPWPYGPDRPCRVLVLGGA